MRKTLAYVCLAGFIVGLLATSASAQQPVFRIKVVKILDADFNEKTCSNCGDEGTSEVLLGEAAPGDSFVIHAWASGWDGDAEARDAGVCNNGDECSVSDQDCTKKHCTDTGNPCLSNLQCNTGVNCVLDTCAPDPTVGSFQWTLDGDTLRNDEPGRLTLAEIPCDLDACEDDPLFEGCACFHEVPYPCQQGCTCCMPGTEAVSCDPDTLTCWNGASAFFNMRDPDWLLAGKPTVLAVNPDVEDMQWLAAISGGGGAAQKQDPSQMGTVVLTSAPCAGGRYVLRMVKDDEQTFLNDSDAIRLPSPLLFPLVINFPASPISDPCDSVSCDDVDPCTVDSCDSSSCEAVCTNDPVVCPPGEVCVNGVCQAPSDDCDTLALSYPPNCAIDARQPSLPDGTGQAGWDQIELTFTGDTGCGAPETGYVVEVEPSGTPPGISSVSVTDETATLTLDSFIEPQKWTCFSHTTASGEVCVGYLPADVNSDGTSNPAIDLGALIDCINLPGTCDDWQANIDRSGAAGALDITRLIDLFNGASAYQSWSAATLPGCPSE